MLITTLRSIHGVADVANLFTLLGYTKHDSPFDDTARIIARWKSFSVIARDADAPREDARDLARKLAVTAERALAVTVGPDRSIAMAAPKFGQPGTTRVLQVSLDHPSKFALQQLERLRPRHSDTSLAHALFVAEILSSEQVTDRFFIAFKIMLERMATSLGDRGSAADRRMFALLALTRILFLYFVQAKGWLDGRSDYLKNLLDETLSKQQNFHHAALRPLFFGTLNRPHRERTSSAIVGKIPYLNGGLFEPHPAERRIGPVSLSNELWRDAFDGVFERFRFCVREEDDSDAIAPDMLGRAFERLMDVGERHSTGTFYTPSSVVRQIVDSAIRLALSNDLRPDLIDRLANSGSIRRGERAAALDALKRLRILDPAVGSGAFLLGALDALLDMRVNVETSTSPTNRWRLRREILRENLFGVDLNPIAVRLAELRLWLAVVADDPAGAIESVVPLPNLDGMVRQGDTLLDPLGAARSFNHGISSVPTRVRKDFCSAQQEVFDAQGKDQKRAMQRLRQSEATMARHLLRAALESTSHTLDDLTAAAQSHDLFGKRAGLTPKQQQRYKTLRRMKGDLEQAQRRLSDGTIPFFSFEVHAPDVLANGGFSVVVGNPPWVRAERLSPERRETLRRRFAWWRTETGRGFRHLPDLSIAFIERCLELTAPGGSVGLLVPSKVTSAGYGETARRNLVRETSIAYIHRVDERSAARFGATTYPLAIVLRKERPSDDHGIRLGFAQTNSVAQQSLDRPGPWILVPDRLRNALEEFRTSGRPLGEVASPVLGVKTGADKLLVGRIVETQDQTATVIFGGRRVTIELSALRPVLRGRDVRAFNAESHLVVLWSHDATGLPNLRLPSETNAYVNSIAERLCTRSDYQRGPIWTLFRVKGALASHRVVWPDIARRPRAVALDQTAGSRAIPLNTCYISPAPDRDTALVVTAILNSTWSMMLCQATADEARGGYRRINAHVAAQIPVPQTGPRYQDLVHLSHLLHQRDHVSDEDLDEAVAEALSISTRSRRVIGSLATDNR